mmetsp:Transcript_28072/g.81151  ORF Transcript_28072/g.81151 Transcript_28072/m.81151 type:complete len:359 (-) Transcript_28072:55-1131(-)
MPAGHDSHVGTVASTLRYSVPLFVLAAAAGTALNFALERTNSLAAVSLKTSPLESKGLHIPPSVYRAGLNLIFYPSSNGEGNDDDQGGRPTKMLIAQYDAGGAASSGYYKEILNATSAINKVYAERYGHDYLLLRGFYLLPPTIAPKWLQPPPEETAAASLATYNKLAVLRLALENTEQYDSLLMLDSDAMVVDFAVDVATAYSHMHSGSGRHGDILLAAQRVSGNNNSWDVNIGVTLWNLQHALTRKVLTQWQRRCRWRLLTGRPAEDQKPLHAVLRRLGDARPVLALGGDDFRYAAGTVIKHFIRPTSKSWKEDAYDSSKRMRDVQESARHVCLVHNLTDCSKFATIEHNLDNNEH